MNLLKLELKKNLKGSIIWGIVLSGVLLLYLAFFPSMTDAGFSELLYSKLNMLPKGLLESLGLAEVPDFSIYGVLQLCFSIFSHCFAIYAMILGT